VAQTHVLAYAERVLSTLWVNWRAYNTFICGPKFTQFFGSMQEESSLITPFSACQYLPFGFLMLSAYLLLQWFTLNQ